MYASELNGKCLVLWQDLDRTEKEKIALSPENTVELKKLIVACKLGQKCQIPAKVPFECIGLIEGIKMFDVMKESLKLMKLYQGMNIEDLMTCFKHPLIRCAISDFCPKESIASSLPMA